MAQKRYNPATEVAFGKVYELPAAVVYAQTQWPGSEVRPAGTYADLDFLVFAGPEGIKHEKTAKLKHKPGEFIAFLEVKKRRVASSAYTSTIVATRKHHAARWGREFFKVPTVCVVVFIDRAGVFQLNEAPDSEENIERRDRPGLSIPHVHYLHTRITWDDALLPAIVASVEDEQDINTSN